MSKRSNLQPILSIDTRRNCIRIHKRTLHLLGDPEYIQLLVNPNARLIAVRRSSRSDNLAHRVKYNRRDERNCFELYSTNLLLNLQSVTKDWKDNTGYRIYGEYNEQNDVAQFSMDNLVLINEPQKE